jgi:Putative papain-like cysteine peptidase (DUF1796)
VTQPDRFISLGRTCKVAFHIRRRLGLERAYPFDWWITPLSSIAPLLRSGFDLDIPRDNLMVPDERNTVINKRWQIRHHHDFPRKHRKIVPNWASHVDTVRAKYRRRSARLLEALNTTDRITFMISQNEDETAESATHLDDICAALEHIAPRLDFRLLAFKFAHAGTDRRVSTPGVNDYGDRFKDAPRHYAKSLKGWDEALAPFIAELGSVPAARPFRAP